MKKIKSSGFQYETAFHELQQILAGLEAGKISLDEMPQQIARAQELLAACRQALRVAQQSQTAFDADLKSEA